MKERRVLHKYFRHLGIAGLVTAIIISVVVLYVSFSQPELTQTQLLLQYWWLYVPGVLFAALAGWLLSEV